MSAGIESRYLMRELGLSCSGEYVNVDEEETKMKSRKKSRMHLYIGCYVVDLLSKIKFVIEKCVVSEKQKERIREITEYVRLEFPGAILYEEDFSKSSLTLKQDYANKIKKIEKFHITDLGFVLIDSGKLVYTHAYLQARFDAAITISHAVVKILKNQSINRQYEVYTAVRTLNGEFSGARHNEDIYKRYKELGLDGTKSSIKINQYTMTEAFINDFMNAESIVFEAEERIARGDIVEKREEAKIKAAANLYYRGIYDGVKYSSDMKKLLRDLGLKDDKMNEYTAKRIVRDTKIEILNQERVSEDEDKIKQAANIVYRNNYTAPTKIQNPFKGSLFECMDELDDDFLDDDDYVELDDSDLDDDLDVEDDIFEKLGMRRDDFKKELGEFLRKRGEANSSIESYDVDADIFADDNKKEE